jgi:hypothetical protein
VDRTEPGAQPSGWVTQPTPTPPGARDSDLNGVSCAAKTSCTAVGIFHNRAGRDRSLAEHWTGHRWSIQPTPKLRGASGSSLSAVSCPSTTTCTAVGLFHTWAGHELTLAERWNGKSWSIQPTPNPAEGSENPTLSSVSCATPTSCTAVGSFQNKAGRERTLAERWNGTSWSIQLIPKSGRATSDSLASVSCASVTICIAVGWSFDSAHGVVAPLAERWSGN